MPTPTLEVNGQAVTLPDSAQATLLHVLRNDLGLNGPKYGCGLGQCGACTVWVDGVPARACVIPAQGVAGRLERDRRMLGRVTIRARWVYDSRGLWLKQLSRWLRGYRDRTNRHLVSHDRVCSVEMLERVQSERSAN